MLTRIFNKSKSINYFFLAIALFLGTLASGFKDKTGFLHTGLVELIGIGVFIVFIVLFLDFIIRKNYLTNSTVFAIFFFSFFTIAFFRFKSDIMLWKILFSNLFLLFAYRRIFNLQNHTQTFKKILDASVWISIASLFYFWNVLFFIPLVIAIVQVQEISFKAFIVPFFGFFAVFILATAYCVTVQDNVFWFTTIIPPLPSDFSVFSTLKVLIPTTILFGVLVWSTVAQVLAFKNIPLKQRPNKKMVFLLLLFSITVAFLFPVKTGNELIFMLPMASIVITNYIENNSEMWFNEMILWLTIGSSILPFIL